MGSQMWYEWIFSGVGAAVPLAILSWWLTKRYSTSRQKQQSGSHSHNVQIGGDVRVEEQRDE